MLAQRRQKESMGATAHVCYVILKATSKQSEGGDGHMITSPSTPIHIPPPDYHKA